MSYILDALRRADAERQQGQVPGLHANAGSAALPQAPRVRARWGWGLALALGALGLGLLGWLSRPAPAPVPPAVVVAAAAPQPVPRLPAPLPIVVTSPPPAAPVIAAAVPAPAAASAVTVPRSVPLQQLPAELRRALPPLVVGGSVWSDSAASRFVILDGQVVREGDSLAPGLVLERIEPKLALLRWREMRIEIGL